MGNESFYQLDVTLGSGTDRMGHDSRQALARVSGHDHAAEWRSEAAARK
jgi:hypothetical protein